GQCLQTNALQLPGNLVIDLPRRAGVGVNDLLKKVVLRRRFEGPAAGQQSIEDHAEAKNVAAAIDAVPLAAGLFRRKVSRRSRIACPAAKVLLLQRYTEVR